MISLNFFTFYYSNSDANFGYVQDIGLNKLTPQYIVDYWPGWRTKDCED
jgi:hypothetical protein